MLPKCCCFLCNWRGQQCAGLQKTKPKQNKSIHFIIYLEMVSLHLDFSMSVNWSKDENGRYFSLWTMFHSESIFLSEVRIWPQNPCHIVNCYKEKQQTVYFIIHLCLWFNFDWKLENCKTQVFELLSPLKYWICSEKHRIQEGTTSCEDIYL